jgi:hypothetical protein
MSDGYVTDIENKWKNTQKEDSRGSERNLRHASVKTDRADMSEIWVLMKCTGLISSVFTRVLSLQLSREVLCEQCVFLLITMFLLSGEFRVSSQRLVAFSSLVEVCVSSPAVFLLNDMVVVRCCATLASSTSCAASTSTSSTLTSSMAQQRRRLLPP